MMGFWFYFVVSSAVFVSCENGLKKTISKPSWTYKCVEYNGCQRSKNPFPLSRSWWGSVYGSLEMCWSVCGPFGGIWPRPLAANLSSDVVKIDPNSYVLELADAPESTRPMLKKMTEIAFNNIRAECARVTISLGPRRVVVHITLKSPNITLSWDTSEQYTLNVSTIDIPEQQLLVVNIEADTVYGVRHGLETFTHLTSAVKSSIYPRCAIYVVSGAKIQDKPVYKHRGLLLDTARHFFHVRSIKRTLDGMAASKMNVFHWHITDSQSFPLQSERVHQFTRFGAFSAQEIYWKRDVKEIIEYAQIRGIRVMIEINGPAHVGRGWQWGEEYGVGNMILCGENGHLNFENPSIYNVLRNLYRDIADYLPSPALFHIGGNGVSFKCWNSSYEIISLLESKFLLRTREGFIRLLAEYFAEVLRTWDEESLAAGKAGHQPVILRSSELTHPSRIQKLINKNRFVIELWDRHEIQILAELLRLGYRLIAAPRKVWYLSNGLAGPGKYSSWKRMYLHRIPANNSRMLGGEACVWTEYINEYNLDIRVWPRAAAVAERLWSNPVSYAKEVSTRMQRHRARLISRGLQPEPISNKWCQQHDYKCK